MKFLLIIFVPHSVYHSCYLLTEPDWFEHFDIFAIRQNLLIEVEFGTDAKGEDAEGFVPFRFLLGVVERQGAEVVCLACGNLQPDLFGLAVGAGDDAVVVVEEVLGVEVVGHREGHAVELGDVEDAVEGINHDAVEVRAECNQIPALLEELHAIGMDVECVTLFAPIALVGDAKLGVRLHRFEDERQIVLSRWNILEEDAVLDGLAVQQQVADGDGLEQPAAKPSAPDFLHIIYIIAILPSVLIDDVDAEHIPNGITPVVEGAFGNIYSSADIITEP